MWIIDNVSLDKDVHVNALKKSFRFSSDRITGNDVFEGHSTFTVVQYMWQSKESN